MNTRILLLAAVALLLGACVTTPKPLRGDFMQISPSDSVNSGGTQTGTAVRWGGRIVETKPKQDNTCFQVISLPLTSSGRPNSTIGDATNGRFVACRAGFYDPAVFAEGREVTFIGRIDGFETVRIGEFDYRLPLVTADVIYLWPQVNQVEVRNFHPYPFYDPFWGPWWGPRWWW
ncbi:MAG: Slp family lipoprotein [Xanthomonadaceae bacterium]|jgi:outer membrane lipoprotein|nr:Slp family lipoprotein [Xanthomonadaceae bacterium]